MMNKVLLTAALLSVTSLLNAVTKDGIVKDKKTGTPLIGAVVRVKELPDIYTTTGLDGTFKLRELPEKGHFTLICNYVAYKEKEMKVDVTDVNSMEIPMDEDNVLLDEVTVVGTMSRNTDVSVMDIEKKSSKVLNAMSAQSIRLSPDVNVATVMQRISGVTMEKDATGEASYAILRGMDKRYNYTLVNGMKIPSPDDKNRYIPLNMFPSDLMDRLVVSKTLTADMEGDATGGAVDMIMKDAPGSFHLQANAATGFSDYFAHSGNDYFSYNHSALTSKAPYEQYGADYNATDNDFKNGALNIKRHNTASPNFMAGLSVGNRFLDGKLGLLLAGSFQNRFRGANRTFYGSDMSWGQQAMDITSREDRRYSYHDQTGGLHGKIDFTVGKHKVEWYNMFVSMTTSGVRLTDEVQYSYGYEPDKGNYTLNNEFRTNKQTQNVFATNLKGTHRLLPNFSIDWAGIFADARSKEPDRAYVYLTSTVVGNEITKTQIDASPGMERRFQHNDDKDWTGYVNLKYDTKFRLADVQWKAGAMYRKKERESRYYSYLFRAVDDLRNDNSFEGLENVEWNVRTPHSQASQLNYDSKEHIGASYAMATVSNRWGELVAGFRMEHTNQIYTMLQRFDNLGQVGEQSYWDYLPSVALKYTPTGNMNIRLSYYKSINRPGFFEVVPYKLMGDDYDEAGNPNLKRARIDNVDLRWEWFPSANEQVLVGLFYKHLKDPIEMAFEQPDGRNLIYKPTNLGNADNYGIELDVVKYIRHFGVKANYTYTHSSITTDKKQNVSGEAASKLVSQKRPLVNQAPHTANLSLLYKDTKYGWNAQLAGAYTGERIAVVSQYKDADQWDKGIFTLDFSAEKTFRNGLSVFIKANNLTDSKNERFLKTVNENNLNYPGQKADKTLIGTYQYGRNYLVGVRFSL